MGVYPLLGDGRVLALAVEWRGECCVVQALAGFRRRGQSEWWLGWLELAVMVAQWFGSS